MKRILTCFALLILTVVFAVSVSAVTTVEIVEAQDLIDLMGNPDGWTADYAYVLKADIDLTGKTQNPIGNGTTMFTGTFDGKGYTVRGINITGTTYTGLFGRIGGGATIENLTTEGTVTGTQYVGGIVGSIGTTGTNGADTATIMNCHNNCSVTATKQVGGVVGYIHSTDTGSTTNARLVGCWNSGTVTATNNGQADVGGVAGILWGVGEVSNCWNTGAVTASSTTTKATCVGGLYGRSHEYAKISNSYSTALVKTNATANVGAFVGNSASATFENCYYNSKDYGTGVTAVGHSDVKGCTDIEEALTALGAAWEGTSRPRLKAMQVKINDEADLLHLMNTPTLWMANVVLQENITLTADSSKQNPIGDNSTGSIGTFFVGSFDGGKYTISGIDIVGDSNNVGLFGVIEGATIKDLTINGKITATSNNNVGGLVGQIRTNAVIENCTNNCTVVGARVMGGIVGLITLADGGSVTITNAVNTGDVTAETSSIAKIGGIVGASNVQAGSLTIKQCYNSGNITGTNYIGGMFGELVGSDADSTTENFVITECWNSGVLTSNATGNAFTGGLFGYLAKVGKVSDCWNTGNISCKAPRAGGFVGSAATYINVTNCYVDCTVTCSTDAEYVRAFCGRPDAKGFNSNYYNSTKCSVEATNTSDFTKAGGEIPTAYTQILFDNLNANELWIIASAPELAIFHKHDFTTGIYVDNGDGTHSRGCACGVAEEGATAEEHTFDDEGGCTKCDGVVELSEIKTAEDMLMLMKYTRLWADGSFKLMNDIDLEDYTGTAYAQTPIGTTDAPFMGTFDGQNHKISGLKLDLDIDHVGLFGAVGNGASIRDLTVEGSVKGNNYVGGIVGIAAIVTVENGSEKKSAVEMTITNCTNLCTVSGGAYVGGVMGYFYGKADAASISGCTNSGIVTATGANAGGIAGILWNVAASNLSNTAAVTGTSNEVGGIVGRTAGSVSITGAKNSGDISGTSYVGGIVGSVGTQDSGASTTVKTVENTGTVSGISQVGGIVGYFHGTGVDASSLTDAANSGSVTTKNETAADGALTGGDDVGGVAGILWNVKASDLHHTSTGTVTGAGINVGGIVGRTAGTVELSDSTNDGAVQYTTGTYTITENGKEKEITVGGNYIGGIVGSVGNSKANAGAASTITDCVNNADISARERVGGIVGYFRGNADTSELKNCTNNGDISTTTGNDVGGITGIAWNIKEVSACKNTGIIKSAAANAGGIVGRMTGVVTVTGCTNEGTVTTTGNSAGGIVGQMMNGELVVSANTNTAAVNGQNAVGGIVGDACTRTDTDATTYTDSVHIEGNVNNGTVTGAQYAAGIIGVVRDESGLTKAMQNGKTAAISKNNNTANVTGDKYVGGIVGAFRGGDTKDDAAASCSITECRNSGKIASVAETTSDGGADVGGIVGMLYAVGDVSNCVNLGDVESKLGWAGGFVGRTASGIYVNIRNCFVSCAVTCADADTAWARAFCGYPLAKNFHACYYDSSKCDVEATNVADYTAVGSEAPTAYATLLFDALNGDGKWVKMALPELALFHTVHDNTLGGVDQGDGTHLSQCPCGAETGDTPVAHTYIGRTGVCVCGAEYTMDSSIDSAEDLLALMNNATLWDGDYTLTANISLKSKTAYPIGGWVEYPIGSAPVPFTGTLNGNGHKITNLNLSGEEYIGLFGLVTGTAADPAKITDLTVSGTVTASGNYAAGVVAYAGTRDSDDSVVVIENCRNNCTVSGKQYVGGLVGYFYGSDTAESDKANNVLSNCFNYGKITATDTKQGDVGGIAGIIWGVGDINNCHATGKVTTSGTNAGGIIGRIHSYANVTNCYANAEVVGTQEGLENVRAFCGNPGYTYGIAACYYNSAKTANEGVDVGIRDYTAEDFDTLNADGLWVELAQPVLKAYHSNHAYTLYIDNGDGTHSPMCPCGVIDSAAAAAEHTRDAYGICTLCGNADACQHLETETYVVGTPNCRTGARQHTRCAICLVDIGTPTEIPADSDAHIAAWQQSGTKQQYVCTVAGCGVVLNEIDTSSITTLYVSKNGSGDGLTMTNPTGDFDAAMQLAAKVATGTVTIYILDEIVIPVAGGAVSYYAYEEPAHTSHIVISGYGDTHAVLKFADVDMKMYYLLSGNTEFRNLEFSTWDNCSYMYLVGRHNKLIIGENVSSDYHRVEGSGGAHSGNIYLIGGCYGTNFSEDCGTKGSDLEIHSGTFRTIVGGSFEGSCCTSGLIEIKFLGDVTARQQIYAGSYLSNTGDIKITIDGNVSAGTFFTFTSANASRKAANVTVILESGSIFTGSFAVEALDMVPVGMCTEDIKQGKKLTDKLTSLTVYTDLNTQSAVVLRDMLYDTVYAMDGADAYGDKVKFLYIAEDTYCAANNGRHTPTDTGTAHPSAKPCIEQGYTEYTCSACTLTYKEPIALQSHALVQISVTDATCMAPKMVKSSCSACHAIVYAVDTTGGAESQPDPTKHQLENGICRICKQDMTASCSHTYGAWENITSSCGSGQRRVCSVCTHVELNLVGTGHNYGKYTVTKEPTATMAGTKSRVCKSCGKVDTALINASGDAINAGALATDASGNLANFDVESSKLSRVEKAALNALLQQDAYGSEVKISYETDGNTVTNLTYHIPVPAEYTEYKNVMVVVKDDNGELHFVDFKIEKGYIVFEF